MKIIDKFIFNRFFIFFFLTLSLFSFFIFIIDLFDKYNILISNNLNFKKIFRYYFFFILFISSFITPVVVFISTFFFTLDLLKNLEIFAILSFGINFFRFFLPYFFSSILLSFINFLFIGWIIPYSNKNRIYFENKYLKNFLYKEIKCINIKISPYNYFYIESYNKKNNIGSNFIMQTIIGNNFLEKFFSKNFQWYFFWKFENWLYNNPNLNIILIGNKINFFLYFFPIDFINYNFCETLNFFELNSFSDKFLKAKLSNINIFLFEKYYRYISSFSIVVLTFLGFTISLNYSYINFFFLFFIFFFYIFFFMIFKSLVVIININFVSFLWFPNACLIIFIFIFFLRNI